MLSDSRSLEMMKSFSANVITGRQIGREIGFPTANLAAHQSIELNNGVYGVRVLHNESEYVGIMNVGVRPTFTEEVAAKHYEVHIFDFNQQIYGEDLQIDVQFYLRDEMKFSSVDELTHQIQADKREALAVWRGEKNAQ